MLEKYCNQSITEVCTTNREIINRVYDHALTFRQPSKVSYRPLTKHPFINMVDKPGADLALFYPDFKDGDYAYIFSCLDGLFEKDMIINIRNCAGAEVYFNGEKADLVAAPNGTFDANVTFKKGQNQLLVRVTAQNGSFGAVIVPLIPGLRMSPGCYVYSTWQYIEKEGFRGQQGVEISRLYRKDEPAPTAERSSIDWVFPVAPAQSNEKHFDFNRLCGRGKSAYAYTVVTGRITITHEAPVKIFAGGREVYCGERGVFCGDYAESTELLIKSTESGGAWGFSAVTNGVHSLPFVDGADCPDLQWLWIGPFGRDMDSIHDPYAPEHHLQFHEPYATVCGQVYWQFYRKETYLKQYLHSIFYGQWFYALMVGLYGLKQAAQKLGKNEFNEYFCSGLKLLCEHRNYGCYDTKQSAWSSYLAISYKLDHLDPIGTIGINMIEYYMMTGDPKAQYMIQLLADSMMYNVPRFDDGTFHRIKTMWTDDTYMCLPFLVRLGVVLEDEKYFDEILAQVRGFVKRMYMEEENLFSHIYFVEQQTPNRIPWGRGNGWVLLALSEVLLLLPETYHGREEILRVFRKFAGGVLAYRDKEKGIWHQVINNPESYIEASGSAMFITALARGVRCGWIDESCKAEILDAWNALCECCIDAEGNVYGVCMGSGCHMEEQYYLNLKTIIND
ncbi:MAG: glycoside hydrolase family 105 protein, partial [Clostridia bacterium]